MKWVIAGALLAGLAFMFWLFFARRRARHASYHFSQSKLEYLERLPVGIRVTISPESVPASAGGRSSLRYTWEYETCLETSGEPLRITQFGAFSRKAKRWILSSAGASCFGSKEFEEWYHCPGALLVPGKAYSDPANYSGGDLLADRRIKWFFIGVDQKGKAFKGEALVRCEGRLAEWSMGCGPPRPVLRENEETFRLSSGLLLLLLRILFSAAAGLALTFFFFYRLAIVRAHVRGGGFWLLAAGCFLLIFFIVRRK